MNRNQLVRWTAVLFIVLLVNTAYIASFASPTVFYMGNVFIHLVLGVVLTVAMFYLLRSFPLSLASWLMRTKRFALGQARRLQRLCVSTWISSASCSTRNASHCKPCRPL
jgi:hypothetical protein